MLSHHSLVVGLSLLSILTAEISLAQTSRPAIEVSGRVVDTHGEPLSNATIAMIARGPSSTVTTNTNTNANGAFSISGASEEQVIVRVHAPGYGLRSFTMPLIADDDPLEIVMEPGVTARVKLISPDGTHAAGVEISALTPPGSDTTTSQRSDAEGNCTFVDLPRNEHLVVSITDDRFLREGVSVTTGDEDTLDLPPVRLTAAGSIHGRVIDPQTSLPASKIMVYASGSIGQSTYAVRATTDAAGNFKLTQLRAAEYTLQPHTASPNAAVGGIRSAPIKVSAGQTVNTPDLIMVPTGSLRGKVIVRETGKPAANVQINVRDSTRGSSNFLQARTADDGSYAVNTAPGEYTVTVAFGIGIPYLTSPPQLARGRGPRQAAPIPTFNR